MHASILQDRRRLLDRPRATCDASGMRALIREVLDALLAAAPRGAELSLDAIGEAVGARPVTVDEIAWLLDRLEAEGRVVAAAAPGGGVTALGTVLRAARTLRAALGRSATVLEIVASTGLAEHDVRRALLLAQVMSR